MGTITRKLLCIIVLLILLTTQSYTAQTKIPLYIPSGATTESSRMYSNMVKDFEIENPDIDVLFKPKSRYDDVLQTVIKLTQQKKSAGVAIVEISELLTLKYANAIIALDELLDQELGGRNSFLKTIIPGFLANSYGDDGKIYGIPLMRSIPIIYYNMDILKKAGITADELPNSWRELTETLKKVKAVTGQPPFILAPTWYGWLFEAFVRQNGGALANKTNTQVQFDHPATIEALSYWKMLLDKGLMRRNRGSWKSIINGFEIGRYHVIYYSSGGMGQLATTAKFNWMTDTIPQNKIYSIPVGAANIFLSKHMTAAEKKAAWKLVHFLLRPNIQAQISNRTGYFPVVQSAFEDPLLKERYSMEQFKRARKQLDFANAKIMTLHYVEIRKILKAAIDRTLDDDMPAEESLKIAQREAQKWLKLRQ